VLHIRGIFLREGVMRAFWSVGGVVAAMVMSVTVASAQAQQGRTAAAVVYVSVDRANYQKVEGAPQISAARAWGDSARPPFAEFVKFDPGFDAGMHSHTNVVTLVVLKGAYLYRDDNGTKRVGVGEVLRIPAGHKHWSGGDAKEGATFYQHMNAKMDMIPAK
jgi:mannose-6-phosphate isomerase-like protein (cupin superfamily)